MSKQNWVKHAWIPKEYTHTRNIESWMHTYSKDSNSEKTILVGGFNPFEQY